MRRALVFFDWDGTLVDLWVRSYGVYRNIVKRHKGKALPKTTYIRLKQRKISTEALLAKTRTETTTSMFTNEWFKVIESPRYLRLNRLAPGAHPLLRRLKKRYTLGVVTLRNDRKLFFRELGRHGLEKAFDYVLVVSGRGKSEKWKEKTKLLTKTKLPLRGAFMVGDSETDIRTGKALGMKTVAVAGGSRAKHLLLQENPDAYITHIADLERVLKRPK